MGVLAGTQTEPIQNETSTAANETSEAAAQTDGIAEPEAKITTLQNELEKSRSELTEAQLANAQLQGQIREYTDEIEDNEKKLIEAERKRADLNNRHQRAIEDLKNRRQIGELSDQQREKYFKDKQQAEAELIEAQKRSNELRQKENELKAQVEEWKTKKEENDNEITVLQERYTQDLQNKQKQIKELEERHRREIERRDEEQKQDRQELENTREQWTDATNQIRRLDDQLNREKLRKVEEDRTKALNRNLENDLRRTEQALRNAESKLQSAKEQANRWEGRYREAQDELEIERKSVDGTTEEIKKQRQEIQQLQNLVRQKEEQKIEAERQAVEMAQKKADEVRQVYETQLALVQQQQAQEQREQISNISQTVESTYQMQQFQSYQQNIISLAQHMVQQYDMQNANVQDATSAYQAFQQIHASLQQETTLNAAARNGNLLRMERQLFETITGAALPEDNARQMILMSTPQAFDSPARVIAGAMSIAMPLDQAYEQLAHMQNRNLYADEQVNQAREIAEAFMQVTQERLSYLTTTFGERARLDPETATGAILMLFAANSPYTQAMEPQDLMYLRSLALRAWVSNNVPIWTPDDDTFWQRLNREYAPGLQGLFDDRRYLTTLGDHIATLRRRAQQQGNDRK